LGSSSLNLFTHLVGSPLSGGLSKSFINTGNGLILIKRFCEVLKVYVD